jgi:hypothetical protein
MGRAMSRQIIGDGVLPSSQVVRHTMPKKNGPRAEYTFSCSPRQAASLQLCPRASADLHDRPPPIAYVREHRTGRTASRAHSLCTIAITYSSTRAAGGLVLLLRRLMLYGEGTGSSYAEGVSPSWKQGHAADELGSWAALYQIEAALALARLARESIRAVNRRQECGYLPL